MCMYYTQGEGGREGGRREGGRGEGGGGREGGGRDVQKSSTIHKITRTEIWCIVALRSSHSC